MTSKQTQLCINCSKNWHHEQLNQIMKAKADPEPENSVGSLQFSTKTEI